MSDPAPSRAQKVVNFIGRLTNTVGIIVLVAMMLLTGIDVFLRYVFNRPILGSVEITELLMVVLSFMAIVWCTSAKLHIKVDLLSNRLSDTTKIVSDIIFYFLYLALIGFITWRSFLEALSVRPTDVYGGARSSILDILHYPFYLLIAVAGGLISLILLIFIGQSIAKVVRKWT